MKNFTKLFLSLLLGIAIAADINAQTIPSSNATANCASCTPTGWSVVTGTPDISNNTNAATTANVVGAGATWTSTLPTPPNGHSHWITIRDVGSLGAEEAIKTTINGLVVGHEYEVTTYSLTAKTNNNGGQSHNQYYAGTFIDKFDFQVTGLPRVNVAPVSQNVWSTNKLRFTATAASMEIAFYPGTNSSASGSTYNLIECVNISVTANAINTIPVAQDKTANTASGTPVVINAFAGAMDYDAGQAVVVSTIDLDPATPGIQNTITTVQGTWTVNHTTGDVTFTPASGFSGVATLPYTIQDNYTLDGVSSPGTSAPKTISVTVAAAPVDLDTDNDGILDCVEKQLEGATMNSLFVIAGNAASGGTIPQNTIRLTPNTANQAGSAWSRNKINFANSFTIRYQARLSASVNDSGADGIATVFHNSPAGTGTVGVNGFGIGAAGIPNGIALEIDTYYNPATSNTGDISDDHGMIWDTDAVANNGVDGFNSPVVSLSGNAVSTGMNIEDGNWHTMEVSWNATTRTLSYRIETTSGTWVTLGTYTHTGSLDNFCSTYFGIPATETNKLVYFGFTASTGGSMNEQSVRILDPCADYPQFVDTDGDGIQDYLDLDSDGDGCADAIEGSGNITAAQLNPDGSINSPEDSNGVPTLANGGQGAGSAYDATINACVCYNPAVISGTGPDTKMGITLLKRAGADNIDNWPMARKSGHIALESNTKGFVITRATTAQINAITNPQEGMMVYDKDLKCLKIYDGTVWSCFNTPTCP